MKLEYFKINLLKLELNFRRLSVLKKSIPRLEAITVD